MAHRLLWGKTDRDRASRAAGGELWHPLIFHAVDTTEVALRFYNRRMSKTHQAALVDAFGSLRVAAFMCGAHDLGKATASFQFQNWPKAKRKDRKDYKDWALNQAQRDWQARALEAGLTPPQSPAKPQHAHLTGTYLPPLLTVPGAGNTKSIKDWSRLLAGHHGHLPNNKAMTPNPYRDGDGTWGQARTQLVTELMTLYKITPAHLTAIKAPVGLAVIAFYMLTVTADWIASNPDFFPYLPEPERDLASYQELSTKQAVVALDTLQMNRWDPQAIEDDWAKVFGNNSKPRPLQQAVKDTVDQALRTATRPGMLVIVEGDTGDGKTEAAFAAANQIAAAQGQSGLYFAMPTKASAEGLLGRLAGFAERSTAHWTEGTARTALVHGTARTSAFIKANKTTELALRSIVGSNTYDDIDDEEYHPAADWYLGSKRGLLAAFAIGTIDQIVLAAQPSLHWALRCGAATQQVVVIDEAHAADDYQNEFLSTYLQIASGAGAAVIVLSATIRHATVQAHINSWRAGIDADTPTDQPHAGDYPRVTVINGDGQLFNAAPPPTKKRTSTVILRPDGETDTRLAAAVADATTGGGNVLIVCNRVDTANNVHAAIRSAMPGVDLTLFDGRFRTQKRARIEASLHTKYGPDSTRTERPRRSVVVATQVAEQSLDLDFDLIITDLAPVDLIFQRRGRSHRHPRTDRPLADECWVRMPAMDGTGPVLHQHQTNKQGDAVGYRNKDAWVYDPARLLSTWADLLHRAGTTSHQGRSFEVTTPTHTSAMVEAVYDNYPNSSPPGVNQHTWQDVLKESDEANQEHINLARYGKVPPLHLLTPIEMTGPEYTKLAAENGQTGWVAKSRLGRPNINLVVVWEHDHNRYSLTPPETVAEPAGKTLYLKDHVDDPWELRQGPDRSATDRLSALLLDNAISANANLAEGIPRTPGWNQNPYLSWHRLVILDHTGTNTAHGLYYDDVTGLRRTPITE